MQIDELEVGNIISLSGLPAMVVDKDQERALVTVKRKSGYYAKMPLEMLCPVMITPYFLVCSLKFLLIGENQTVLQKRIGEHWVTAVQTHLRTWCMMIDTGEVAEVMWIHQVQNFIKLIIDDSRVKLEVRSGTIK